MNNVAIIGRPNVGKSALFNRLVGRRIAIVHDQPGITRDRISAHAEASGTPFTLWDTGGIAGTSEMQLAKEVRAAAERAIQDCDVLLFVVDAQDGQTPMDRELAHALRRAQKPVLLVINKIDHPKHEPQAADFASLGFAHSYLISSAHGRGLTEMLPALAALLPDQTVPSAPSESPLQIAILGRPNAGKSSLSNTLVGDERTIVSELPGTTRDAVDIRLARNGEEYALIDTAGIRARSKHSTSVEVFSVMRAEKTVARADLCLLVVDLSAGVTAQDRHIAGLIQKAQKPCIIVLNKWDLVSAGGRGQRELMAQVIATTQAELFFVNYAPILVTSAHTGAYVERIWKQIERVRRGARFHIGTGRLNRVLRDAFASNPPQMVGGKRLKLFYAAQAANAERAKIPPPEFALFVNSPRLLAPTFARFLEGKIREIAPYPGLPILLALRARFVEDEAPARAGGATTPAQGRRQR